MSQAQAYIAAFQTVVAAFAEARAVREEATEHEASDAARYAVDSIVVGLERLAIAARRLGNTPEGKDANATATPVFADPNFRRVFAQAADGIDALRGFVGVGAKRTAALMRAMLANNDATQWATLYCQAESLTRGVKRKKVAA